jgi:ABC-2 type transport system ATP-binding protein
VCLGRTLLNDPRFLILDEPAAGLDPKARLEFKNLVRILRAQGRTLLISSHILTELGEMCDTLIFMDAGRVVHHGDKESLQRRDETTGQAYDITVLGEVAPLVARLELEAGWKVLDVRRDGVRAECAQPDPAAVAVTLRRLCAELPVLEFRREERRLEEAFVEMLRKPAARPSASPLPPSLPGRGRPGTASPLGVDKGDPPVLKLASHHKPAEEGNKL